MITTHEREHRDERVSTTTRCCPSNSEIAASQRPRQYFTIVQDVLRTSQDHNRAGVPARPIRIENILHFRPASFSSLPHQIPQQMGFSVLSETRNCLSIDLPSSISPAAFRADVAFYGVPPGPSAKSAKTFRYQCHYCVDNDSSSTLYDRHVSGNAGRRRFVEKESGGAPRASPINMVTPCVLICLAGTPFRPRGV